METMLTFVDAVNNEAVITDQARGVGVRHGSLRRFTVSINANNQLYNKDHSSNDKKR